ncbi:excinuclease ABC subunit A [candidate division CPR3 bacterium GWF2_35_18]|uniref:UvrABC system protein A n=1 Tax=candidate division CPR3 bacterium GW2011_GWF2_35_18 TaxID=1618350 RepID=A0A0G0E465_UNCC3|nr:MAG: UvrABC system protein A [candidate division CPR3 bacterium GW2011_GWF2_35_18]OGB63342.1 MAG: excinuclease ABC subunit A [candidate division CPR3 bacterium GWF2_35_18]OGB65589.1 MAG: excinuclease ABC subunit A [candidate division CPR3 bacterium RIFOXYA2_FULL_35_13]
MQNIIIRGARQHNLKNINVDIPRNKLVVFTGLSGSGKSSLAIDTIYAEGQRRYVESLSSYARQFLGVMDKPDVDSIEGLSPAISITQKTTSHNPRSTVGTITEIYDYLRVLYARIGHPHCPNCGREISHQTIPQIVNQIFKIGDNNDKLAKKRGIRLIFLAPLIKDRKGEYSKLFDSLRQRGYFNVRIDGEFRSLQEDFVLIKTNKHSIDVEIGRIVLDNNQNPETLRQKIIELTEQGLKLGESNLIVAEIKDASFEVPTFPKVTADHLFSERFACPECNISLPELEPRNFSFNTPHGACPTCTGIGTTLNVDKSLILAPNLTIAEGAIIPYARMLSYDSWMFRLLEEVAKSHQIDLQKPVIRFSEKELNLVLYGTGDESYTILGDDSTHKIKQYTTTFEGIIPNLERRYKQTDSDFIRGEIEKFMRLDPCPTCQGKRLKPESLGVTIYEINIAQISEYAIRKLHKWLSDLSENNNSLLSERETIIAKPILKETMARLQFLIDVGLDYLTLSRSANTLAGGEMQRIRLASQIGSGLTGVLYILDEPTIGLHQRDNTRLINTLKRLRDLGNTVIVVEHDAEMIESADYVVDFGPGAGEHGGQIVSQGTPEHIKNDKNSVTGKYLSNQKQIKPYVSEEFLLKNNLHQKSKNTHSLELIGATDHNLKNLTVSFPLGQFICITGVSGSGKSTLIHDTLYYALKEQLKEGNIKPGSYKKIKGMEFIDKVILIDQSPIGRTPRSNPATYTGVFNHIRDLFTDTPESRARGYQMGRFSFNVKGGRCENCEGEGMIKIEMQFLPDVYVTCEACNGKRYNRDTLEIHYKDKNISEILNMTVEEGMKFFTNIPRIASKLETLFDVGLSYIRLGQPAPTLSGGEAQRVKLASELSKKQTGRTLYLLDEPTTGLHFADIEKLLNVLKRLVAHGNTIIIIEHNLDVIKNADYVIDLGPEGGDEGGRIIAMGKPEEIANTKESYTGQYLQKLITQNSNIKG